MPQSSGYSSQGFSISYYDPLPTGGSSLGNLDIEIQNWRHEISAFGGYISASFELMENQYSLRDWIANGLFRPIVVSDNALVPMWEGFVDSITVSEAGLSLTYGPVTEIANRIFAIYSGVDTSVYPPQIGVRKKTPTLNDTTSQSRWGIWHKILSLAGVTDSNADQLLSMYLQEHNHPELNSNFNFTSEEVSMSVSCMGWYSTLNYPYNQTATSGEITLTNRIKAILNAHPNSGWISSDQSNIATNNLTIPQFDNDDQLALEHIRGVVAMGDNNNIRNTFGIYEDRKAFYGPVSQEIDYIVELGDPQRQVLDASGSIVAPWRIRPGKWIFFSDYLPGLGVPTSDNFHLDPRMLRIESVQFDMRVPYAVQWAGGITSKYEQRSAQLGLRGTEV